VIKETTIEEEEDQQESCSEGNSYGSILNFHSRTPLENESRSALFYEQIDGRKLRRHRAKMIAKD
jgi:hypothetical protein